MRLARSAGFRRQSPGVVIAVAAAVYLLVDSNGYHLTVASLVGTYAISAIGLTVVAGRARQVSLGQAGFMAIGAYTEAFGTTAWHLPSLVALLLGAVLAALCGVVLGYVALRLDGNFLAMATLAFGLIVYSLLIVNGPTGGASGKFGIPPLSIFGHQIVTPASTYAVTWICVVLAIFGCSLFLRGQVGRELHAIRDDPLAAASYGVNLTFRKVQAFALSAGLGGLAGGLIPPSQGVVDPSSFQPGTSFQVFLMIVIGGLGSLGGAVAGAAIVTVLIQVSPGTGDTALTVLGVMVIGVIALLPRGLAGLVELRALRRVGTEGADAPKESVSAAGGA